MQSRHTAPDLFDTHAQSPGLKQLHEDYYDHHRMGRPEKSRYLEVLGTSYELNEFREQEDVLPFPTVNAVHQSSAKILHDMEPLLSMLGWYILVVKLIFGGFQG